MRLIFLQIGIVLIAVSAGFWLGTNVKRIPQSTTLPVASEEPSSHVELPVVVLPTITEYPRPAVTPALPRTSDRPQFVILSFDGSWSLDVWDKTIEFARTMRAQQKPVSFTYFISGVYFLPYASRMQYHPPGLAAGTSSIGFASNAKDIAARVEKINTAIADGHEIGTHFNGHFDGSSWSQADWESELSQFYNFVFDPSHALTIGKSDIHGARTPVLGVNDNYYKMIESNGLTYDASKTGKPDAWPYKLDGKIWEFPLARITYVPTGTQILSMDYNFYFKQTGGQDTLVRDTPAWNDAYHAMLDSYMLYFDDNYAGTRAPVVIGHHFSLWNDGVYWDALKQFAYNVCGMPDVQCTTFSHVKEYLDGI